MAQSGGLKCQSVALDFKIAHDVVDNLERFVSAPVSSCQPSALVTALCRPKGGVKMEQERETPAVLSANCAGRLYWQHYLRVL
jgi:hypothetical protein